MQQEGKSAESQLGLPEYRGHSIAEKTAFAALILFVGAAAAGAFGGGPASEAKAVSDSGKLQIEYHRFLRRDAAELLQISLPTAAGSEEIELTINTAYLRRVQITDVFPEPAESMSQQTGKLRFKTDGSGTPVEVLLHYEARLPGQMIADIAAGAPGAEQTEQVRLRQFVYP